MLRVATTAAVVSYLIASLVFKTRCDWLLGWNVLLRQGQLYLAVSFRTQLARNFVASTSFFCSYIFSIPFCWIIFGNGFELVAFFSAQRNKQNKIFKTCLT